MKYKNCFRRVVSFMMAVSLLAATSVTKAPSVWAANDDEVLMFEVAEDLDGLAITSYEGLKELSMEVARSGQTSAKLTPDTTNRYAFAKKYDALINKVVTLWVYDDMSTETKAMIKISETTAGGVESDIGNKDGRAGIMINGDNSKYVIRLGDSGGNDTEVDRSEGWHRLTWDYTSGTSAELYIDGEHIGSHPANGFDAILIENHWQKTAQVLYIDDLSVTDSVDDYIKVLPTPTNGLVDDENDTFAWTNVTGYDGVEAYEYSLDAGITYNQCTANPQVIGDVDLGVGQVKVRLKATSLIHIAGGVVVNNRPFTKSGVVINTDESYMFEEGSDLDIFAITKYSGVSALSTKVSRSGQTSVEITPDGSNHYAYAKQYDVLKNKVVTLWVYDDMTSETRAMIKMSETTAGGVESDIENKAGRAGIMINASRSKYVIRLGDSGGNDTQVERSKGWHRLTWDYTSGTSAELYIDGEHIGSHPANGFDAILIENHWQKSNKALYIDDFSITDSMEEYIKVLPSPLNDVYDDDLDTFGFDKVVGYDLITDYEYSLDFGQTYVECSDTTIQLMDMEYAVGQIVVRLKAQGGTQGQLLRSRMSYTIKLLLGEADLIALLERSKCYNKADYDVTDEVWTEFETAISEAQIALSSGTGIQDALTNLESKGDGLIVDIENYRAYNFLDDVTPFTVSAGVQCIDDKNISSIDGKGFMINTEAIGGKHVASASYTFAHKVDETNVSFWFRDFRQQPSGLEFRIGDEKNAVVLYGKPNGTSDGYYYTYEVINGVKQPLNSTGIRRLADWHELTFDFANQNGVKIYIDNRLILSSDLVLDFDRIDMTYEHASKADYMIIDEFKMAKNNPIASISLPDEEITMGYYDTYTIGYGNVTVTALDTSYPTTDRLAFSVSDSTIIKATADGVVEGGNQYGQAIATVTAVKSGQSDSIIVDYKDIKVESIAISDSLYTAEANSVNGVEIELGDSKVLNAIMTEGATDRLVTWHSSNEEVFVVDEGLIATTGIGIAELTATSNDGGYTATCIITVTDDVHIYGREIYVSSNGSDTLGAGTIVSPFATIEKARDEIRSSALPNGGVVVYFREGTYPILEGVEFENQDSGTVDQPIAYKAYNNEKVVFRGSIDIKSSEFEHLSESTPLYGEIQEGVRDQAYVTDLSALGIDTAKELQIVGHSAGVLKSVKECAAAYKDTENFDSPYYSVMFDQEDMTLARYPNNGEVKISELVDPGARPRVWKDDIIGRPDYIIAENRKPYDGFEIKSNSIGDRYLNWVGVEDIWLKGYWYNEFSDQTVPVKEVKSDGTIETRIPSGYGVKSGKKFYVYNLLQEMDVAGEWFIDQENFDLYIVPPAGADMASEHLVQIAYLEDDMITMNSTSFITIEGIDMEVMLGKAIVINGGHDNIIRDGKISGTREKAGSISNITNASNDIVDMAKNNGFVNMFFYQVNGGVSIGGGDKETLEAGGNYVQGCKFETFSTLNASYNPAVNLDGVGNAASFNDISDAPHNALMYSGNDHVIEFNTMYDVVQEAGDQSAIYTGRDVLSRGTVMRENYFHNVGNKTTHVDNSAIYLDDLASGVLIIDNTVEEAHWGIFVNGGRDNHIIGNTFKDVDDGLSITNWGYVGINNWNVHGYGTYKNAGTMALITNDWNSDISPYNKYENLKNILVDDPAAGKYGKSIDNKGINVSSDMVNVVDRKVGNNGNAWVKSWYYTKGTEKVANNLISHQIVVSSNDATIGSAAGSNKVLDGDLQRIMALPNVGYKFVNWSENGQVISTDSTYVLKVNRDRSIIANFEAYTLEESISHNTGDDNGNSNPSNNNPSNNNPSNNNPSNNNPSSNNDNDDVVAIDDETIAEGIVNFNKPYISGYPDGCFKGNQAITRIEMVSIMAKILELDATSAPEHGFSDVESAHWANNALSSVKEIGLIEGYGDGTFKPNQEMSRAEIAVVIARYWTYIGYKAEPAQAELNDIKGHWAEEAINQLFNEALIIGFGDKTYRPEDKLLREQVVVVINKLVARPDYIRTESKFSDINVEHWAFGAIEAASSYYNGDDNFTEEAIGQN